MTTQPDRPGADGERWNFFSVQCKSPRVEQRQKEKVIHYERKGAANELIVDDILIGVGRAPNVEGLGLDRIGVAYDATHGVKVNARLQTTRPTLCGGRYLFSVESAHTADAMAQNVIQNALFPHPLGLGYASTDSLIIPWCPTRSLKSRTSANMRRRRSREASMWRRLRVP